MEGIRILKLEKMQKILIAIYVVYIVVFYGTLLNGNEFVLEYADFIELIGFALAMILICIGIKKHSPEKRLP